MYRSIIWDLHEFYYFNYSSTETLNCSYVTPYLTVSLFNIDRKVYISASWLQIITFINWLAPTIFGLKVECLNVANH